VTDPSGAPTSSPHSLLGLPPTDPDDCEVSVDVDVRGVVHAELISNDPAVVERSAR
jgi:hypothetical protein